MAQPIARAAVGRIERWADFPSRHVDARHVDVWVPADYDAKARAGRRFAVLYAHDGQMLFDAATTWNQKAWRLDMAAQRVQSAGQAREFIIVGPWNGGARRASEFFPTKALPYLPASVREPYVAEALDGRARGDDYLRFLVDELKPAIDAHYATRTGRDDCVLMGSSRGGIISLYGLCEYPAVFGGAACLSTHWITTYERNAAFPSALLDYLDTALPAPQTIRLWTDRGTLGLDGLYDESHARATAFLHSRGFAAPRFVSRVVEGTTHSEDDWGDRAGDALHFLLADPAP